MLFEVLWEFPDRDYPENRGKNVNTQMGCEFVELA